MARIIISLLGCWAWGTYVGIKCREAGIPKWVGILIAGAGAILIVELSKYI